MYGSSPLVYSLALVLTLVFSVFSVNIVETLSARWLRLQRLRILFSLTFITLLGVTSTFIATYRWRSILPKLYASERVSTLGIAEVSSCMGSTPYQSCLTPIDTEKRHIFGLGDSHMASLAPSLNAASKLLGHEFTYWGGVEFTRRIFDQKCTDECLFDLDILLDHIISHSNKNDIIAIHLSRNRIYINPDTYNPIEFMLYQGISRNGKENKSGLAHLSRMLSYTGS